MPVEHLVPYLARANPELVSRPALRVKSQVILADIAIGCGVLYAYLDHFGSIANSAYQRAMANLNKLPEARQP